MNDSPSLLLRRAAATCTDYEAADWVTDQWWFWLLLVLAAVGVGAIIGCTIIETRRTR